MAAVRKGFRDLAYTVLYARVEIDLDYYLIDPGALHQRRLPRMMRLIQQYTKELYVAHSHSENYNEVLFEVLGYLPSAALRIFCLRYIGIDDRCLNLLDEILNDPEIDQDGVTPRPSQLQEALEVLYLPYYRGSAEPEPELLDCDLMYTYGTRSSRSHRFLQVHAHGEITDDEERRISTPLDLLQRVSTSYSATFGFDHIVDLTIQPTIGRNDVVLNPLASSHLGPSFHMPCEVLRLRLKHTALEDRLPIDFYGSMDLKNIEYLEMYECNQQESLYRRLIACASESGLDNLTIIRITNFTVKPEWEKGSADNLEALLTRFGGLKELLILVCADWKPDLDRMLEKHSGLLSSILSFGKNSFSPAMVAKVNRYCPQLINFCFRSNVFGKYIKSGRFEDTTEVGTTEPKNGFDTSFAPLAAELAKFKHLKMLEGIFSPSPEMRKMPLPTFTSGVTPSGPCLDPKWWPDDFRRRFWPDGLNPRQHDAYHITCTRILQHIRMATTFPDLELEEIVLLPLAMPRTGQTHEEYWDEVSSEGFADLARKPLKCKH